jgi:hypothetical protein
MVASYSGDLSLDHSGLMVMCWQGLTEKTIQDRVIGMRRSWLAVMLSLIAACGAAPSAVTGAPTSSIPGPITTIEEATTASVTGTTPLEATCGAVMLPVTEPLALPDQPLDGVALNALEEADRTLGMEGGFFDAYTWVIAEHSEQRLVLFGRAPGDDSADGFADATFELRDGEWVASGWGGCHVVVSAPGYGNAATWATDPQSAPDPAFSELAIQIMERNCANGEAPEGREILPVVQRAADRVTITVLVEPVPGFANCPGNPWYPVVVDIGEPMGDRVLYDGSTLPAVERIWPPPENPVNG